MPRLFVLSLLAACAHHPPPVAIDPGAVAAIALESAADVARTIEPTTAPECFALDAIVAVADGTAAALRSRSILPGLQLRAGRCLDLPGLTDVAPPPPVVVTIVRQVRSAVDLAVALAGTRITCADREALTAAGAYLGDLAIQVVDEFGSPDGEIDIEARVIGTCAGVE